jgi:hypothetical protein
VVGYFFWGCFQQLFFCAWCGTRLRKAFPPSAAPRLVPGKKQRLRVTLFSGLAAAIVLAPAGWLSVRSLYGSGAASLRLLAWFGSFSFLAGALWGWFYCRDRKRLLVATLTGSFFGLIHIDSYGLVVVTWILGTILAWLAMEDRYRNLAVFGFMHGLLGTTFGNLFNVAQAGVLRVGYRVGPWNVQDQTPWVLVVPLVCLAAYLALAAYVGRRWWR